MSIFGLSNLSDAEKIVLSHGLPRTGKQITAEIDSGSDMYTLIGDLCERLDITKIGIRLLRTMAFAIGYTLESEDLGSRHIEYTAVSCTGYPIVAGNSHDVGIWLEDQILLMKRMGNLNENLEVLVPFNKLKVGMNPW